MNEIIETYSCNECGSLSVFDPCLKSHLCPNCNVEMQYICTEEIDKNTGKVVRNLTPPANKQSTNLKTFVNPTTYENKQLMIECPYCKSTNTTKITSTAKVVNIALFGIFGNKRKYQWHCNRCDSNF